MLSQAEFKAAAKELQQHMYEDDYSGSRETPVHISCGQLSSVQVHSARHVNWPQSTINLTETALKMSKPSSKCPENPAQKVLTS